MLRGTLVQGLGTHWAVLPKTIWPPTPWEGASRGRFRLGVRVKPGQTSDFTAFVVFFSCWFIFRYCDRFIEKV